MGPAFIVALLVVWSVLYIIWRVVRVIRYRRRVLPPPTKEAMRYSRPDAVP